MKNKRLQAILDLIEDADIVADIATDHGNLAIELIRSKKSKFVLAVDVVEEIISKLNKKLQKLGIFGDVVAVKNDGLKGLQDVHFDYIVISGLGGLLIGDILKEFIFSSNFDKSIEDTVFILQPMTCQKELRACLSVYGFSWLKEIVVIDKKRYYNILVVKLSSDICKNAPLSYFELPFCPTQNEEYTSYLEYEKQKIIKVLSELENKVGRGTDFDKSLYFKDLLKEVVGRRKKLDCNKGLDEY